MAFTLFPKLPVEIQTQIWLFSLPGPRIIQLQRNWRLGKSIAKAEPIILLRVCHHSRVVALQVYKVALGAPNAAPLYLDVTRDVVLMDDIYGGDYVQLFEHSGKNPGIQCFAIAPTYPLNVNIGIGDWGAVEHDITNDGLFVIAEVIMGCKSLAEVLVLYPVNKDQEVPDWFERNTLDLLENQLQDAEEMPLITVLPYEAENARAGKCKALRDWMNENLT